VALIVNELVMNALKHAQPASGPAVINVRLVRHGAGQVRLSVADNGAAPEQSPSEVAGLGTQLIRMLARQLNGTVGLEREDGTYAVHVTFPLQSPVSWRPPY
jgi:two-component sensor histidine kinase